MMLSEIYGKKIITSGGKILGDVKEIVLDIENGQVSHLLTTKLEQLARSSDVREALSKNSIICLPLSSNNSQEAVM